MLMTRTGLPMRCHWETSGIPLHKRISLNREKNIVLITEQAFSDGSIVLEQFQGLSVMDQDIIMTISHP